MKKISKAPPKPKALKAAKATALPSASLAAQPDTSDLIGGKYHKHEIEHAANTVMDAHAIMNDKEKMAHVSKHLSARKKAISSVEDLKNLHQKKFGPKE